MLAYREWPWGMALVAALTAVWLLNPGELSQQARESAFESMGVLFPRRQTTDDVVIVDIDRESLNRVGAWPWRRSLIATLVQNAAAAGASAIAVDILLSGKDRNGPSALAGELAAMSGKDVGGLFEDDDRLLAAAIAKASNVVLGIILDDVGRDPAPIPPPLDVQGSTAGISPRATEGLLGPPENIAAAAAGIGGLSFHSNILSRVASAPILVSAAGDIFPGFAIEAIRISQEASLLVFKDRPSRVIAGTVKALVDSAAEMRLHFATGDTGQTRTVPAWSLLASRSPAGEALAGKIVLIGSTAPEAGAFLPTAGSPLTPTVVIQAAAIDQILVGRSVIREPQSAWWEAAAMLLLGTAAIAAASAMPPAATAVLVVALMAGWSAFVAFAFTRFGLLVDPVGPNAAVFLGANTTAFAAFVRARTLKNVILQRFERYVPPEVIARLLREPEALRLDGELREVTALLTDVEGFSQMTERSEPKLLVASLDEYFDLVTELIVGHGGMVDKIVGDAVLAFFNIPTPLAGHADAAVACAQAIVGATEDFRRRERPKAMGFGRTRCGIETGMAIVGDVGGRRRLDYTAYGTVVNKAARFQDANKTLGSSICLGPATAAALSDRYQLRPLGRIEVRGFQGTCEVSEPWTPDVPESLRATYVKAVALHASNSAEARTVFEALAEQRPGDAVIASWLQRLPS